MERETCPKAGLGVHATPEEPSPVEEKPRDWTIKDCKIFYEPVSLEERFDPTAHHAESPATFWWDEQSSYEHVKHLACIICVIWAFLMCGLWKVLALPLVCYLLKWYVSLLPKRHLVVPQYPLIDHEEDRRPDAHKMMDITRSAQYYRWKKVSIPLPIVWSQTVTLFTSSWLLKKSEVLYTLYSVIRACGLDLDPFGLVVALIQELWTRYYPRFALVGRVLRALVPNSIIKRAVYAFITFLITGMVRAYSITGQEQMEVWALTIFSFTILEFLIICSQSVYQMDIDVSHNMLKQLSILKCCDPNSDPSLVRERMIQTAKSICTVNFDESKVLNKQRIVENTVLVAFYAYMDARRINEDFHFTL